MDNGKIFCYSGTGNSYAAAKQLSNSFDNMPIVHITKELTQKAETVECDTCFIIYPSYAYGLPIEVRKWLKKTSFKVKYLALIVTYGTSPRGTNAEAIRLLKKKGQQVNYSAKAQSVENYVHLFGHASEEDRVKNTAAQATDMTALVEKFKNSETNKEKMFTPFSRYVSCLFRVVRNTFAARYKLTKECNNCEICRRVCPTNAIEMREKKGKLRPYFKTLECDHCQACMQLCPHNAIVYMKIKPNSPRYKHKDVTLTELIKRE